MAKKIETWTANDGREFSSKAEAEAHEDKLAFKALLGMTEKDLRGIAAYTDKARCEQLTMLWNKMQQARAAAGDVKKRKKPDAAPSTDAGAKPPGEPDASVSQPLNNEPPMGSGPSPAPADADEA